MYTITRTVAESDGGEGKRGSRTVEVGNHGVIRQLSCMMLPQSSCCRGRDRKIGVWQPVTLMATGDVTIGDTQVITTLPLPDISSAAIGISVPLHNRSLQKASGQLLLHFDDFDLTRTVNLPPGDGPDNVLVPDNSQQLLMLVNDVGAVATGMVTIIVLIAKFTSGAWVTALLVRRLSGSWSP